MMFGRALALLDRIQQRLALDRGSALSRALKEKQEGTLSTEKAVALTESLSIPDGSPATQPVGRHPSSLPVERASRRKRKPVQVAGKKRKPVKAFAPTHTESPSGKTGES